MDTINEVINKGQKISFQMIEYSLKKRRGVHNDGEKYREMVKKAAEAV